LKDKSDETLNKLKKIRKEMHDINIIRDLDDTDKQLLLLSMLNLDVNQSGENISGQNKIAKSS
jgi:hypothetical protein